MFEHFTFGAQAQTSYLGPEDISASPTDCSFPATASAPTSYFPQTGFRGPINDIVDQLSQQTLVPDETPNQSIWSNSLPSPDFSTGTSIDDEFTPEEMCCDPSTRSISSSSISSTSSLPNLPHPRSSTNTNTVACRRLQRQLNIQLQSCNSYTKDISTLIEDMLTTNTQCRLHKTPPRPILSGPPPSGLVPSTKAELEAELTIETLPALDSAERAISPDEDEGFAEMDDPFGILAFEKEMSLRRASAPSGIRKYNVVRWRKSAECIGSCTTLARTKIRSVPRLRRRKVDTVVE